MKTIIEERRIRKCPECKSSYVIERRDKDHLLCTECGFVISPATKRLRENEQTIHKINSPIDSRASKSKKKSTIGCTRSNIISKLENVKIEDSWERNLIRALQQITQIAIKLSLPERVLEKSASIYKQIVEKGLIQGRSLTVVSGTVVYLSCEQIGIGITIKDIAKELDTSPKKIIHCYRQIARILGFSIQPSRIEVHLIEISRRLKLSSPLMDLAQKVIRNLEQTQRLIGKDPRALACGAIYLSSVFFGEQITQREISQAGNVTETTIRSRFRELRSAVLFNIRL